MNREGGDLQGITNGIDGMNINRAIKGWNIHKRNSDLEIAMNSCNQSRCLNAAQGT